jgi:hypothetical protein
MSTLSVDDVGARLPSSFSASVILEQSPSDSPWADDKWEAIGVTAGSADDPEPAVTLIYEKKGVRRFLNSGFTLHLYVDECESYYHNLMSPTPRCYIVADPDDNGAPTPVLISLSFDEAHAYLEGEEIVYAVDIPAEFYRWCEAFVLQHYVPEKKLKRKLKNWKAADNGDGTNA